MHNHPSDARTIPNPHNYKNVFIIIIHVWPLWFVKVRHLTWQQGFWDLQALDHTEIYAHSRFKFNNDLVFTILGPCYNTKCLAFISLHKMRVFHISYVISTFTWFSIRIALRCIKLQCFNVRVLQYNLHKTHFWYILTAWDIGFFFDVLSCRRRVV